MNEKEYKLVKDEDGVVEFEEKEKLCDPFNNSGCTNCKD